jgi:hypothetical protein
MRGLGRILLPILLCLTLFGGRGPVAEHIVSVSGQFLDYCAHGSKGSVPQGENKDCDGDCCEVSENYVLGDFVLRDGASSIRPAFFWRAARMFVSPSSADRFEFIALVNGARAPPLA